jgi:hypothetical protein
MIKTGRYGQVSWDPAATTPVPLIALNGWKLSLKTDYEDVTCFQDTNKVYVPGMRDVSGSLGGFWDSTNTLIFEATGASSPGLLELVPNTTEPTFLFKGPAYLDADIDCTVKGAPKVASNFRAAGAWSEEPVGP